MVIFYIITDFNHFEVELIDRFDDQVPPPAISMCSACPQDPPPQSNFRQDFIRFWARGEGKSRKNTKSFMFSMKSSFIMLTQKKLRSQEIQRDVTRPTGLMLTCQTS